MHDGLQPMRQANHTTPKRPWSYSSTVASATTVVARSCSSNAIRLGLHLQDEVLGERLLDTLKLDDLALDKEIGDLQLHALLARLVVHRDGGVDVEEPSEAHCDAACYSKLRHNT